MNKKKVLICEDHAIVYTGLKLLLDQSTRYELTGYTQKGADLIPLIRQHNPDILILDLNLPDTDGFTLLKSIREFTSRLRVIILTMYQDEHLVERARQEGANAYLLKNASNDELLQTLDNLDNQKFYVTKELEQELNRKKMFKDAFVQKMKLTKREIEIIRLLAMGKSSPQVSTELSISAFTVDTHRKNIFRKLEINNIADLVRFAHDHKIV
jgi:DNA-binding NarL/FixJ family response regulator